MVLSYAMSLFQLNIGSTVFGGQRRQPASPVVQRAAPFRLAREINLSASCDGLCLAAEGLAGAFIPYGQRQAIRRADGEEKEQQSTITVHGIIGILQLFTRDYLVCITETRQCTSYPLRGVQDTEAPFGIYEIAQTLAVPLHSQAEAQAAIADYERKHSNGILQAANSLTSSTSHEKKESVSYGLGAYLWPKARTTFEVTTPISDDEVSRQALDSRILNEALREMRSGLYYAYDFDATRNLQYKINRNKSLQEVPATNSPKGKKKQVEGSWPLHLLSEPDQDTPFWKRADSRFWWNRHLAKPFTAANLDHFTYPIFQGFVDEDIIDLAPTLTDGSRAEPTALKLAIVSRRSIERPGLRYQRRGIDKDGGVANFVESEFVVATEENSEVDAENHVASYIQTRGSIPLYWSQSPWSLKPVPVLERSSEENATAISRHFAIQHENYGPVNIINLAEDDGKEATVVLAYQKAVEDLDDDHLSYTAWNFHRICRGMKYENISLLIDMIAPTLNEQNFLWATDSKLYTAQNGVFRVNCMDCLDRTNVIQSAICRQVVDTCLARFGLFPLDGSERTQLDTAFNEHWASNGDAISRQYAGTSALKGDFTRTGKRNLRGMINDATNSIARLYQNTVGDFFKQTMLDYILGENLLSFAEFQDKLSSDDPRNLHHLATIRTIAIETCKKQLVEEEGPPLLEMTILAPSQSAEHANHLPEEYEEKILILTRKFVYVVSYEYTLQKIRDFVKIPVLCLSGVTHGTLILSTLSTFARDPVDNYGFVIRYNFMDGEGVETRTNTYSLRTKSRRRPSQSDVILPSTQRQLVFKAVRSNLHGKDLSATEISQTSQALIIRATEKLSQAFNDASGDKLDIQQNDIRSLKDAQAAEGIFARIYNQLENYIWL